VECRQVLQASRRNNCVGELSARTDALFERLAIVDNIFCCCRNLLVSYIWRDLQCACFVYNATDVLWKRLGCVVYLARIVVIDCLCNQVCWRIHHIHISDLWCFYDILCCRLLFLRLRFQFLVDFFQFSFQHWNNRTATPVSIELVEFG